MPTCVIRKTVADSSNRAEPIRSSLEPASTTTKSKCRASPLTACPPTLWWPEHPSTLKEPPAPTTPSCALPQASTAGSHPPGRGSRSAVAIEYSVSIPRLMATSPRGRPRSTSRVLPSDSWASATAKFDARVVTPQPPFVPRNTKSLAAFLFSWGGAPERRFEARIRAAATSAGSSGKVKYSRTPTRMK